MHPVSRNRLLLMYVALTSSFSIVSSDFSKILLRNKFVILLRDDEVLIWGFPTLHPSHSFTDEMITTIPPTWIDRLHGIRRPVAGYRKCFLIDEIDNWYTDSGCAIFFDVFPHSRSVPRDLRPILPTFYRFRLDIPGTSSNISLTNIGEFYHYSANKDQFGYPHSQGNIFACWIRAMSLRSHPRPMLFSQCPNPGPLDRRIMLSYVQALDEFFCSSNETHWKWLFLIYFAILNGVRDISYHRMV